MLSYHWSQDADSTVPRVQAALLLMQLIACTSSWPGAMIETNCYKDLAQVFKYKVCPP